MMDERTDLGKSVSELCLAAHSDGCEDAEIIGVLMGTASAEAIFAEWDEETFLEVCRMSFRDLQEAAAVVSPTNPARDAVGRVIKFVREGLGRK